MQVIILAGGYGTRLYPLTLNAPKPMVSVGGRPMIEYLIDKIDALGVFDEIFIVTNKKFAYIFDLWKKDKQREDIVVVNDGTTSPDNRLGSLGDIQFVLDHYTIDQDVMILGGDNFFEDSLGGLVDAFHKQGNILGLYDTKSLEATKQFNNLTLDTSNKITSFIEKPEFPFSTLSATLIYCFKNDTLKHIKTVIESGKADRAGDLIAYLCSVVNIYGYPLQGKWIDIGSMDQLAAAEEWVATRGENSSISLDEKQINV